MRQCFRLTGSKQAWMLVVRSACCTDKPGASFSPAGPRRLRVPIVLEMALSAFNRFLPWVPPRLNALMKLCSTKRNESIAEEVQFPPLSFG